MLPLERLVREIVQDFKGPVRCFIRLCFTMPFGISFRLSFVGGIRSRGTVPIPIDVPRLKKVGVHGVITLDEPYETLVPTSLYQSNDISHLVIPTRDYCFAPPFSDIRQAVYSIDDKSSLILDWLILIGL